MEYSSSGMVNTNKTAAEYRETIKRQQDQRFRNLIEKIYREIEAATSLEKFEVVIKFNQSPMKLIEKAKTHLEIKGFIVGINSHSEIYVSWKETEK